MSLLLMMSFVLIGLSSAFISGLTGLAGGVLLLSCLSLQFPLAVVIPLHAFIQVIANFSRVFLLKEHIEWKIWRAFNLLSIPAGLLGAYSVTFLPKDMIKLAVGMVILLAALYTLKPSLKKRVARPIKPNKLPSVSDHEISALQLTDKQTAQQKSSQSRSDEHDLDNSGRYVALGALSSLLGMVVGATGPLIAPFFMIAGLKRERFIATKSACQFTVQIIKTILFVQFLSFDYSIYATELSLTIIGVFIGTWSAKKVLVQIKGAWLETVIAFMLITLAIRMIVSVI